MAILTLPDDIPIRSQNWTLQPQYFETVSPYTQRKLITDREFSVWFCTLDFYNISHTDAARLIARLERSRGGVDQFRITNILPRIAAATTVNAQGGTARATYNTATGVFSFTNLANNTEILSEGDMFNVGDQLYKATAEMVSSQNGMGEATPTAQPKLAYRVSTAMDAVFISPSAIMTIDGELPTIGGDVNYLHSFSVDFREHIVS